MAHLTQCMKVGCLVAIAWLSDSWVVRLLACQTPGLSDFWVQYFKQLPAIHSLHLPHNIKCMSTHTIPTLCIPHCTPSSLVPRPHPQWWGNRLGTRLHPLTEEP